MDGRTTGTARGVRHLADFGEAWARAELHGDTEALDALLTPDFRAVGPRGFPLDREQWLDRYRSGALVHDLFEWQDVEIRRYGDGAVALGIQTQQSVHEGRDMDGCFRATQYLTASGPGGWQLAAIHLSPIAGHPAI